ncbi:response regulator [Shewanella sp. SR43-4]|jgi:CheY-like chemotaxis protein|uniref:Response regulator n=1 Tax=Shewanella vesiculosa TaxID=518738 RepID=A0ABV0FKI2_9GAMM|nr:MULTISPECIES: response regulator [Shewanella]NCQ44176.1 response regulator [Shewanella frigidimarina]MBB1317454.1 response regulator [Shewanella sp. SR43-4]MBB1321558.1 response regulator [Shewanella sp. SR43-8]MBB1437575.1 response regulator [Shewanella sp. SG41-4]MBB1475012.1 response regulator [Shewanella sp. SG41-3]|tara:strand:- start:10378 stop:10815 length:438 start_codon:yes stop_codon:yes gene_type:complete
MRENILLHKQVTIFIVDDDDVDVLGIERALKKLRIANPTIRAKDGIEALELLRKKAIAKPYIILLDINMPRMGGIDFLKELRADDDLCGSVVFILTTSSDDQDKMLAYKKNVAGYIVKKQVGESFLNIVDMLGHYWRVVELPYNE